MQRRAAWGQCSAQPIAPTKGQKRWGRPPVARWANGPEHEWAQGELAADRVAIAEIKRERASDWALP
jgi:hypothetical protein